VFDGFLYAAIPYLAVAIAIVGGMIRYSRDQFSYSSQSSQFLESRALFWGSLTFHYGLLLVLGGHVVGLMFWDGWERVLSSPTRLYSFEISGLALTILALGGLLVLLGRRIFNARIRSVTTVMDWVLLFFLLAQMTLGLWVALEFRWGSSWYQYSVVPWLHSLFKLDPQFESVAVLPLVVKVHIVTGFGLVALFPFTRLVHIVTVPLAYLWRPYQVVIWNRRRFGAALGAPETRTSWRERMPWSATTQR
jgi:nitrate reductase gamma subunit